MLGKIKFYRALFFPIWKLIGQICWHIELGCNSSNMPTYLTNIFHIWLNSVLIKSIQCKFLQDIYLERKLSFVSSKKVLCF